MTKLQELLKQINRKHVYIQTHNFPDPDAIASALGIQELLKHNGISSTICYKGKIDRYSTDKLRELMEIELLNVEDLSTILTDEDEVILVDAQKGNSNIVDITRTRSSASIIIRKMKSFHTGLKTSGRKWEHVRRSLHSISLKIISRWIEESPRL